MDIRLLNRLKHAKRYQSRPFHKLQLIHHNENMIHENDVVMIVPQIQLLVDKRIDVYEYLRVSIAIEDELNYIEVAITVELILMLLKFLRKVIDQ